MLINVSQTRLKEANNDTSAYNSTSVVIGFRIRARRFLADSCGLSFCAQPLMADGVMAAPPTAEATSALRREPSQSQANPVGPFRGRLSSGRLASAKTCSSLDTREDGTVRSVERTSLNMRSGWGILRFGLVAPKTSVALPSAVHFIERRTIMRLLLLSLTVWCVAGTCFAQDSDIARGLDDISYELRKIRREIDYANSYGDYYIGNYGYTGGFLPLQPTYRITPKMIRNYNKHYYRYQNAQKKRAKR